jgi:AmiR/NasT family two-component response regulator
MHTAQAKSQKAEGGRRTRLGGWPLMAATLTALVADDEQLAREELCFLLEQMDGINVVAQAANGVEALEEIARMSPDVAFSTCRCPVLPVSKWRAGCCKAANDLA